MLLNKDRALEYMRRCQIDVLVATSPVNITYFSGYYCWLDPLFKDYMSTPGAASELAQRYAVLPLESEPALVVSPMFAVNAGDTWVTDLAFFGSSGLDFSLPPRALPGQANRLLDQLKTPSPNATPTAALLSILKARQLEGARIGIEMEGLTPSAKAELLGGLPNATIKDCSNLIRLIRMVKSEEEIRRMTRAAEIAEIAAMEALAHARPGSNASDLTARFRSRIGELGADIDHFAYGVYGIGIATEREHTFDLDSVEYVDFGCRYGYYLSDSGVTLAFQQPPTPLKQRYAALRECMDAGRNLIRPGTKASVAQAAMQQTLKRHNIVDTNPHGHGVGLEVRDYPIIVPDTGLRIHDDCVDVPADLPFEENMVVNLEAPLYIGGVGSLHIEETFVVTSDGCRPLTRQERSQVYIPAALAG